MSRWSWIRDLMSGFHTGGVISFPQPEDRALALFPRCFHCGTDRWYEGPSGGISINLLCGTCGQKVNYAPNMLCEPIGVDEDIRDAYDIHAGIGYEAARGTDHWAVIQRQRAAMKQRVPVAPPPVEKAKRKEHRRALEL